MRLMLISAATLAALGCAATARAQDDAALPVDEPITIDGIEVVCTGVGDEARYDPRWQTYSVRIEFAGGDAQYLADLEIAVSDRTGAPIVQARCNSPWFLAELPPGKYTVAGTFEGLTKTANFTAPQSGQARVVVRFPEIVDGD